MKEIILKFSQWENLRFLVRFRGDFALFFSDGAGALLHKGVEDGHCGHGFDDRDGTGYDADVVAASNFDHRGLATGIDGGQRHGHCGYWFECNPEDDGHAVGYAALYASGVIGGGDDAAVGVGPK